VLALLQKNMLLNEKKIKEIKDYAKTEKNNGTGC